MPRETARRDEVARGGHRLRARARPGRAEPAAAGRRARHQRPDAALPLRRARTTWSRPCSGSPTTARSREVRALPAGARRASARCSTCGRRSTSPRLDRCQRMYVEAAALGLLGREPYVARACARPTSVWIDAVADYLVASGVPRDRARRGRSALLDAAMMGFLLDLPLDAGDPAQDAGGARTSPTRWRRSPGRDRRVRAARRRPRRARTTSPSSTSHRRHRSRCSGVGHTASSRLRCTGSVAVAQHRQQPAAALPVGAGVGLRPPRPARRTPGSRPARHAHRSATGHAPHRGLAADAHERTELHHADRPGGGGRPSVGQQRWSRGRARRGSSDGGRAAPRRRTARPSTRRTLVSSTTCRCRKANEATAAAV